MRQIQRVIKGIEVTDGAGVELKRVIGQPALNMLDPFLLLDAFRSDNPDDYIAGFPPHPHRGFETVTYLLKGKMHHKDNAGNEGTIEPGGIQWMTAGRGIVHSEMPKQKNGLLEGFQLWVNLPAENKMDSPAYQEYSADQIPSEQRDGGVTLKVITGTTSMNTTGPVTQPLTEPLYLDVQLPAGQKFIEPINEKHNAFVYVIDGPVIIAGNSDKELHRDDLAVMSPGNEVRISALNKNARFLLVTGKPLYEPVARGGPFVMNTKEQIDKAFADYKAGNFD